MDIGAPITYNHHVVSRVRRRHRTLATAIAIVLSTSGLTLAVERSVEADDDPRVELGVAAAQALDAVPEPVVEADDDPIADLVVTVSTNDELPVPEPPPANPYAPTPEIRHGLLEIPAIGLSQPLFEGVTLTSINRGPSHWPGTAMPGELGNVVVAGHRTTYSRPFWDLDLLQPGDELVFRTLPGTFTYALVETEVVPASAVHIIDQTPEHRATLFACHPKGSARQRIVGHFELVDEVRHQNLLGARPA